jgi:hypothetical protein
MRHTTKSADGLEYNSKGYLMPPQSGNVWDLGTVLLAMAIPLIATHATIQVPFPSLVLNSLSIFQVMISQRLVSSDEVAEMEMLFALLLMTRVVGFFPFFKKFAGKYSEQIPPPDALRSLWPRQIRLLLWAAVLLVAIPLIFGIVAQRSSMFADYLIAQGVFLPIFILSCGLWGLTEVAYSATLYSFFYLRYWRFLG